MLLCGVRSTYGFRALHRTWSEMGVEGSGPGALHALNLHLCRQYWNGIESACCSVLPLVLNHLPARVSVVTLLP